MSLRPARITQQGQEPQDFRFLGITRTEEKVAIFELVSDFQPRYSILLFH